MNLFIILILLSSNLFKYEYFKDSFSIRFYDTQKDFRIILSSDSLSNSYYSEKYNENLNLVNYIITHKVNNLIKTCNKEESQDSIKSIIMTKLNFNVIIKENIEKLFYMVDYQQDTITIDEVMDIASYYFFVMRVNKDKSLYATICTGNNGLPNHREDIDLIKSGFIFSNLFENIRDTKYNLFSDFSKLISNYNKMYLELDDNDRINKIQKEIFIKMQDDENLKSMYIDKIKQLSYSPYFLKL